MGDLLMERNMNGEFACPFCWSTIETNTHLFFGCDWIRSAWFGSEIGLHVQLDSGNTIRSWLDKFLMWCSSAEEYINQAGVYSCVLLYHIWEARNAAKFEFKIPNRASLLRRSSVVTQSCCKAFREDLPNPPLNPHPINDLTSLFPVIPRDSILIRFDAAFHRDTGCASAGCLAWNDVGDLVGAAVRSFKAKGPEEAEMVASEVAALLACFLGSYNYVFQGDCKEVIQSLNGDGCRWSLQALHFAITKLLSRLESVIFSWVRRSVNGDAHQLAQWALHQLPLTALPMCMMETNSVPLWL